MPVSGGVYIGGVMSLIILTQIVVIVVLLLRQSAQGKANKMYENIFELPKLLQQLVNIIYSLYIETLLSPLRVSTR